MKHLLFDVIIIIDDEMTTWVKIEDIFFDDRNILKYLGHVLNVKHINFSQRMIKQKFSVINGLRLTLLQDNLHTEQTEKSTQINENHWVYSQTASVTIRIILVAKERRTFK